AVSKVTGYHPSRRAVSRAPLDARPMLLYRILIVLALFLVPCVVTAQDIDKAAVDACGQLMRGGTRIADGVASSAFEMELEMRSVYRKAEESRDPVLRQKAGALVHALQQLGRGSAAPATTAVAALFAHCRDVVLR